jgi:hypothetical protein
MAVSLDQALGAQIAAGCQQAVGFLQGGIQGREGQ